jgi:hypothetical protein
LKPAALAAEPQTHPFPSPEYRSEKKKSGVGQKGVSNMLSNDEVAEKMKSQEMTFSEHAVGEALQIEAVLNRAYEIRRARGGLLGYDLEDWLQAERELAEKNHKHKFQVEETAQAESMPAGQERNWEQCLRINN